MNYFRSADGTLYAGDLNPYSPTDRPATLEEVTAWNARVACPPAVTMRQARLALLQAGMLETVNAAVEAMPGAVGAAARIEWEYSQEVQRDKELVLALAPVLGLNSAQLDALFVAAAQL